MKIRNSTKVIITGVLAFLLVFCVHLQVKAAGSFSPSAGKTTMAIGEKTALNINATQCAGTFKITSSDNSVVSIEGDSLVWAENGTQESSVTLSAKKAGKATITIAAQSVNDTTNESKIEGSRAITITVNAPQKTPDTSDATLKSITVAGKIYTNPSTDITINVGADVTTTQITAVATNSKATISGTGTKELTTGTNTVTLTVKGPSGGTKTYTVRIRKLASTDNNPNVTNQDTEPTPEENTNYEPELLRLNYLLIEDAELSPAFDPDIFEYTVLVRNVDRIDIVKSSNFEDATIEITGNENLVEGDNEVIIKLSKEDEEVEYRIIVTKQTVDMQAPEETNQNEDENTNFFGTTTGKIIIIVAVIVVVGGVIVFRAIRGPSSRREAKRAARRHSSYDDFDD